MFQLITRAEAKAQSLPRFFTGRACKKGHRADFYTSNGACCICVNDSRKLKPEQRMVYPTDLNSRQVALKSSHVLPWVLSETERVVNPDGSKPSNFILQKVRFTERQLKTEILKRKPKEKIKLTILSQANFFYLKNKDNEVHSTRYPNRDAAAVAAHKIANGLIRWSPTIKRINTSTNYSNQP